MNGDFLRPTARTPSRLGRHLLDLGRRDVARLFRAGVPHLFLALMGTQGLSFVRRILLARILTVMELGQMTYVMQIADMIAMLADFGICTAVLKFASEPISEEQKCRIYVGGLFWSTLLSSVVATGYLCVALCVNLHESPLVRLYILLVAPYIVASTVAKVPMLMMQASRQIQQMARLTIITQALGLIVNVGATWRFGLWGFFLTVTLAPVVNLLILLYATRERLYGWGSTRSVFRPLFTFGSFSAVANFAGYATTALTVILLKTLTKSDELVGLYSVALLMSTGFRLLPQALLQVAFPYLSSLLREPLKLAHRARQLGLKQAVVLASCTLVWVLIGSSVIALVFGERFRSAFWPSVVLLAGLIPYAASAAQGYMLMIFNAVQRNTLISSAQCAVTALLCLALIPRYSILGAAWASVIGQCVASLLTLADAHVVLRRRLADTAVRASDEPRISGATG